MKLGIELTTVCEFHIPSGSHFELRITVNGVALESTAGRDQYCTPVTFGKGARIAASGRMNIWDARSSPPCTLRVHPAYPIAVPIGPGDVLGLEVRTSIPLGQGELHSGFAAHVITRPSNFVKTFPLHDPEVEIDWVSRGRFKIALCTWPPGHAPEPK